jgi:pimeloyl-ACP methyl ester carboxylesterase
MDVETGFTWINGVDVYWEARGSGGTPLILVHGGYGLASEFHMLAGGLAQHRRVIAVELEGHGHTRLARRAFRWQTFADDLAGAIVELAHEPADLLGYSLGGTAALRCAIQHPGLVRRLIVVSAPHRRSAWRPGTLAAFDGMSSALFPEFRRSHVYEEWLAVAPDPGAFPALMDATGALLREPYDWSRPVAALPMPVLLALADADSIPVSAAAEFFSLLGGGHGDISGDGSGRPASRLAILPGTTHFDILDAPALHEAVEGFLAGQVRA